MKRQKGSKRISGFKSQRHSPSHADSLYTVPTATTKTLLGDSIREGVLQGNICESVNAVDSSLYTDTNKQTDNTYSHQITRWIRSVEGVSYRKTNAVQNKNKPYTKVRSIQSYTGFIIGRLHTNGNGRYITETYIIIDYTPCGYFH